MLTENQIPWRNAMDGSTSGPIATEYGVRAWPTIYLIDHDGVIVHKGRFTDEQVEALVAAAEKAAGAGGPQK